MQDEHAENRTNPTDAAERQPAPGSKGYPEPGSGYDESETVTVEDGPPIKKSDGEPSAFGEVNRGDREP